MSLDKNENAAGVWWMPRGLPGLGLLIGLWLIINASVEIPVLVTGAVISLAIFWIFVRRNDAWSQIHLTPRGVWHFLIYTVVFVIELVKANINVLRYVYSPFINIRPGIVKVHMRLRSPIGRLALANSIALTPGSLVIDVRGDTMFIHWLDVKTTDPDEATAMIAGPFEGHLGAVFG